MTDALTTPTVAHSDGPWHAEPPPSPRSMHSIRTRDGKVVVFVNRLPNATANANAISNTPNGLLAHLSRHSITEHDDGTFTVSPSILVTGTVGDSAKKVTWHGYLECGVWRAV